MTDPFDDIIVDPRFKKMNEEQQVQLLNQHSDAFRGAYGRNPEAAIDYLRNRTGWEPKPTTTTGNLIRQGAYGFGESLTDIPKGAAQLAEATAHMFGSNWETGIDEAISTYQEEMFPAPKTEAEKVARQAGYGAGVGVSMFAGGAGVARTGLPVLAKIGRFLSGRAPVSIGLGTEAVAGAAGGGAGEYVTQKTGDAWLGLGAAVLASGGIGLAAARRARLPGGGAQPPAVGTAGPQTPAARAAKNAIDNVTAAEQEAIAQVDGVFDPKIMTPAWEGMSNEILEEFVSDTHAVMHPELLKRITTATNAVLKRVGVQRDKSKTMAAQLMEVIEADLLSPKQMDDILRASGGITKEQLVAAYLMTSRHHGRGLQIFSAAARGLGRALTPKEKKELAGIINLEGKGFWQRLENVRRGALVTQLATFMRNVETQTANLTIHGIEDALELAIQNLFRFSPAAKAANPVKPFRTVSRLLTAGWGQTKKEADTLRQFLLDNEFTEMERLFRRYSSDVPDVVAGGRGTLAGLEKAVHIANYFNRFQEYGLRRAVFTDELDRLLEIKGKASLSKLIERGQLKQIERADIRKAVDRALEMTWGKEFRSTDAGLPGFAGNLIDGINKLAFGPFRATQILPFPRFMMNALEWQFKHSPFGFMKQMMSAEGRAAFRAGDMKPLTQAITGTGMFLGAYQARKSQPTDGKWYLIQAPQAAVDLLGLEDGATIDTRPFNPFSMYMFAADVVHRMLNDNLNTLTVRDIVMGFMSTNMRAGAGLYMLDQALNKFAEDFQAVDSDGTARMAVEKGLKFADEYIGASWSGLFVPFQQLKDIAAHFDENQRVVRDPFLGENIGEATFGQIARRIPFADENLPEVQIPTQAGPVKNVAPLTRQFTGAIFKSAANPVQREVDKFGFTQADIMQGTGNERMDSRIAKYMGDMEPMMSQLVESQDYKNASPEMQRLLLHRMFNKVRGAAAERAAKENPQLWEETKEARLSRDVRRFERSRGNLVKDRRERMERQRRAQ